MENETIQKMLEALVVRIDFSELAGIVERVMQLCDSSKLSPAEALEEVERQDRQELVELLVGFGVDSVRAGQVTASPALYETLIGARALQHSSVDRALLTDYFQLVGGLPDFPKAFAEVGRTILKGGADRG